MPALGQRLLRSILCLSAALALVAGGDACGQTINAKQKILFTGLRSIAGKGKIRSLATDSASNIYLLFDQDDGVRLIKITGDAQTMLAQAQLGTHGDIGVALALDPAGNVYVTGTSRSGSLLGTSGAAIPLPTSGTTNSFVAKFDSTLQPLFVSFTGGSKIAANALAASADAVFVTGTTYAADLPVTDGGIEQSPAYGSGGNGFVEKFSAAGDKLLYATYLSGALGDTSPAAITIDAYDHAWIVGSTSAPGFATVGALVPEMVSAVSGFALELAPAGDGILWSTFVPGDGLTSVRLTQDSKDLLLSGAISLGQFPVDTVAAPLAPTAYQILVRMALDGSAVHSAAVLAPAGSSSLAPDNTGSVWVAGTSSQGVPSLLPATSFLGIGDGWAMRLNPRNLIDQAIRLGGVPVDNGTYASLSLEIGGLAVDASGALILGGTIQPTASSSLLATQRYDLPLSAGIEAALPSSLKDAEPAAATCNGSLCAGSAGYLTKVDLTNGDASLTFSADDLPFVTLRNLGSMPASNVVLQTSAGSFTASCGTSLAPGAECQVLLGGGLAGTLTVTSDTAPASTTFPAYSFPPTLSRIVSTPRALAFGLASSAGNAAPQIITITNLGSTLQTFTSALEPENQTATTFKEASTDCPGTGQMNQKVLAPGASCHVSVAFVVSTDPANDGPILDRWLIAGREISLTGYGQAAAVNVSSTTIDFGTQYDGGLTSPRYLYLSNASSSSVNHADVTLAPTSAFQLDDQCPRVLLARSVCRMRVDYRSKLAPSADTAQLTLDAGLLVAITGTTKSAPDAGGATVDPNLTVAPFSETFADAVPVTGVSGTTQTVSITNSGQSTFSLALLLTGDFVQSTSCGSTLAGGASCAVAINFAPSQPGPRQGLLAVTAGAGTSPVYVTLYGIAGPLFVGDQGILDAGTVPVGQPKLLYNKVSGPFTALTVTATGPYRVALIEDIGYGHGQPPFSKFVPTTTGTCHQCWLAVRFQPSAVGAQPGSLTLSSDPLGHPYVLSLAGRGDAISGLVLTPGVHDFGAVPINSVSAVTVFTLRNLSSAGTAINLDPPSVTGDFTLQPPGDRTACASTLAFGASCTLAVKFSPQAAGVRPGTLGITSNSLAASSSLSGTGVADPGISLDPTALNFENSAAVSATQQVIQVRNTGTLPLHIEAPALTTTNFTAAAACSTLSPGDGCTITVGFQAGPAPVSDVLILPVSAGGLSATTYAIPLIGNYTAAGAGLIVFPGTTEFGALATGTQGPAAQFMVINSTAKVLDLSLAMPRQFGLVTPPCSRLLAGSDCSFEVQFDPLVNGDVAGSILVSGIPEDGTPPLSTIAYAEGFGIGTGALLIRGGVLPGGIYDFGQITSGQSAQHTFTISNPDLESIVIRRITSAPPFTAVSNCGPPLAGGAACMVTVTYTPTNQVAAGTALAAGTRDVGSLVIESDAQASPDEVQLGGQAGPIAVVNPVNQRPLSSYTLSQSSLSFSDTAVGDNSAPQTVQLLNSGTSVLYIFSAAASSDFATSTTCSTVAPGLTCTITVASSPQAPGLQLQSLEIASDSTTSLEFISLIARGLQPPLTFSAPSLNFGTVQVGSSEALALQVTNTSSASITFMSVATVGDYSFTGGCLAAGMTLAAQSTCTVQVVFTPQGAGVRAGTLAVSSSATTLPLTVSLKGSGTQSHLIVSPAALAFGSLVLGVPRSLLITLSNAGTAPVSALSLATSDDYAVTIPCPSAVLQPNGSCSAQITFLPTLAGPRNASLTILSNDPASPAIVPLTGSGFANGSFTLSANGATAAGATVQSGQFTTYRVQATPTGNYSGAVALTCAPVQPVQYVTCSLLPALVTLAGGSQTAIVTLNTIASGTAQATTVPQNLAHSLGKIAYALLLPSLIFVLRMRRGLRKLRAMQILSVLVLACTGFLGGCGGGSPSNIHYATPGTYQFIVTGSSTAGPQITATVTLTLVVTLR